MSRAPDLRTIADSIFQSVVASPKRVRRLRSSTFWAAFHVARRTDHLIQSVRAVMAANKLIVTMPPDMMFGKEPPKAWITIAYIEPPPPQPQPPTNALGTAIAVPNAEWFEKLAHREFESEREVEYYLMLPLLEKLGYTEDDLAIGYPVVMYEGVRRVNKIADAVLFDGSNHSKGNALFVVEAKKKSKALPISEDSIGQARAYAMWLSTPYYFVTNGDDIRVFVFRGALQDVMVLDFNRNELQAKWAEFHGYLNKAAVIAYKRQVADAFPPPIPSGK